MTTALVAAKAGLQVLICEKAAKVGGTSATSAGTLWLPGNRLWRTEEKDNREAVERYLRNEIGAALREDLLHAFLDSAPQAADFLNSVGAGLVPSRGNPDYHADQPDGATGGRAVAPEPFDGKLLGSDFALLRAPHTVLMIFGGMMINRRELPDFLQPFASKGSAVRVMRLLWRHFRDRLRYPRGTRLLLGNSLMARLLIAVRKNGVELATETALVDLVSGTSGKVLGALVDARTGRRRIRAKRAVVLATGGYPGRLLQVAKEAGLTPQQVRCYAFPESQGDGLSAALRAGAMIDCSGNGTALWTPVSVYRDRLGRETIWAHHSLDRGKPGCIAVDGKGRRFVNEADSYHDFVLGMLSKSAVPAFLICDRSFVWRYGLGLIRPRWQRLSPWIRDGYLHRADSIADLARRIGADPTVLQETVDRSNAQAAAGQDPDFGRGSRVLNLLNGDLEHRPSPCLGTIRRPPFFALPVLPGVLGTAAGISTDADGRALQWSGTPIAGLYAVGGDMASVMRGSYPGPGINLGPGVTFAYRAGRSLSGSSCR